MQKYVEKMKSYKRNFVDFLLHSPQMRLDEALVETVPEPHSSDLYTSHLLPNRSGY